MSDRAKEFMLLAATSSRVSDELLLMTSADDRLISNMPVLDGLAQASLDATFDVSVDVWRFLAKSCGPGEHEVGNVMTRSMHATLVSLCYFNWRIKELRQPPFSFCVGDIDTHLDALAVGPEPAGEFMKAVWALVSVGSCRTELKELFELLGGVSCSNISGEQGHAAASVLSQAHTAYEMSTLQHRAQLLQFRPLVKPDPAVATIQRLQARLRKLASAQLQYFTGRQALIQDLSRTATLLRGLGRDWPRYTQQRVVHGAGQIWRSLSSAQQWRYERSAEERRAIRHEENMDAMGDIREGLDARQHKLATARAGRPKFQLGACRLGAQGLAKLDAIYKSDKYTQSHIDERVHELKQSVGGAIS